MTTTATLSAFIRYSLDQLRSQNKHHEFEHIARHFARAKISDRFLPATGPVGAGGDQGRDFETYRSYLTSTQIAETSFLSHDSGKILVGACSLQQNDIQAKIRSDIGTICSGPDSVDCIYYFCEVNIPVALRHALQAWSRQEHNVDLEIFDGTALAEALANTDTFWIAEEFLSVPSDMYPTDTREIKEFYSASKKRWLNDDHVPQTYADFTEVKYAVRQATFDTQLKPDLLNWINLLLKFRSQTSFDDIRRRSTYEICVAALRGINNLTKYRDLVIEYFDANLNQMELAELRDFGTLLLYCTGAYRHGNLEIEITHLRKWTINYEQEIVERLAHASGPYSRCELLDLFGLCSFLLYKEEPPVIDPQAAFDQWEQLLDEVDQAPLFPLESFADGLTALIPVIGEHPRFIPLTQKLDELLSSRTSAYVAAEKCRDRAVKYHEAGQYVQAIGQLHKAKVSWFSAETLEGSLLAMLTLCDCYLHLDLYYAARYFALAVSFIASQHPDDKLKRFLSVGLQQYCDCCFLSGDWANGFQALMPWCYAHQAFDPDPFDIDKHSGYKQNLLFAAIGKSISDRFDPKLAEWIAQGLTDPLVQAEIGGYTKMLIEKTTATFWKDADEDEVWQALEEQLSAAPFSDVGESRLIRWSALGVTWEVESNNDHLTASLAEEVSATLQIVIVDLANVDLVLLPTTAYMLVEVWENEEIGSTWIPDNSRVALQVQIPKAWVGTVENLDNLQNGLLGCATMLLRGCSALPNDEFKTVISAALEHGLQSKTFTARSYSELFREFLPETVFDSTGRKQFTRLLPLREFQVKKNPLLGWNSSDGPGYTRDKAHEFLENRYRKAVGRIRYTLKRFAGTERFQAIVTSLRSEGLRDWQILTIVMSIVIQERTEQLVGDRRDLNAMKEQLNELANRDEHKDDIEVPVSVLSDDRIEIQKMVQLVANSRTWNLALTRETPDLQALKRLLDVRYHQDTDDIEHDDLL